MKGAALSVRNLVTSKASEHEGGWLGLALEVRRAGSLEDFLGEDAASDIDTINTGTEAAASVLNDVTSVGSSVSDQARRVFDLLILTQYMDLIREVGTGSAFLNAGLCIVLLYFVFNWGEDLLILTQYIDLIKEVGTGSAFLNAGFCIAFIYIIFNP